MRDGRVTGDRLHLTHRDAMRSTGERVLNSPMLITEGDFEVQDFFARTLKTKMAWFDYARVHRPDGDFVNLATIDAKKFSVGRRGAGRFSDGLEPGMTFRREIVLLPDFAFEEMSLRMCDRERGIVS